MEIKQLPENIPSDVLVALEEMATAVYQTSAIVQHVVFMAPLLDGVALSVRTETEQ